jgi:hypothetical protein
VPLISENVNPTPPLVQQQKKNSCWAAATAVIFGWRTGIPITDAEAAAQLGPNYRILYQADDPLPFNVTADWARAAAIEELPPANLTVSTFQAELKRNKPVIVGKANIAGSHLVVVVGLDGDGSPAKTNVKFVDPDGGAMRTLTFVQLQQEFEKLVPPTGPVPTQLFRVL